MLQSNVVGFKGIGIATWQNGGERMSIDTTIPMAHIQYGSVGIPRADERIAHQAISKPSKYSSHSRNPVLLG